jgi:hypothetical protein
MQSIWAAWRQARAAGQRGEVRSRQVRDRHFEVHRIVYRSGKNVTRVTDTEQRIEAALYPSDTAYSSEAVMEGIA